MDGRCRFTGCLYRCERTWSTNRWPKVYTIKRGEHTAAASSWCECSPHATCEFLRRTVPRAEREPGWRVDAACTKPASRAPAGDQTDGARGGIPDPAGYLGEG